MTPSKCLHALVLLLCGVVPSVQGAEGPAKLSFNRDIRPILSDNCFYCHGPDAAKQKSNLRLDIRDSALKGGKSELPALVPGKPEGSEMFTRVCSEDADEHMPPKKSGKKLTTGQIALLKRWISEGAEYEGLWTFIKPTRPSLPVLKKLSAGQNPIDLFIGERLEAEGLSFSPEADKATLLRRASLDLTGVPPSPGELKNYLADGSPNSYEKALDRLFSSPRYGEAMAVQWLDFARYADSNGFQSDESRDMSLWRDWAINAFNQNKPFDQFTIEQLAGDLLPNPTIDQIVATGFNRNHRLNGEGGRIVEEWFAETVIDRIETTSSTWMGLTVGCARCHDHKFDPISQKEFYQLFAFFNSNDETGVLEKGRNTEPVLSLATPEQTVEESGLRSKVATAKDALKQAESSADLVAAAFEKAGNIPANWTVLTPVKLQSQNGAQLIQEADGIVFSAGSNPATDVYTITAPATLERITAIRLELLSDTRLPAHGPGRHPNGNPVLSEFEVLLEHTQARAEEQLPIGSASADYSQPDYGIERAIDQKTNTGWAVMPNVGQSHSAVFTLKNPLTVAPGSHLRFVLTQNFGVGALIGKLRLSATNALLPEAVPAPVQEVLALTPTQRNAKQKALLKTFLREKDPAFSNAKKDFDGSTKALEDFRKNLPTTMVMREIAKPRDAHILVRGQYDKPGEKVGRALPAALPPLPPGAPLNRLGLAQWLVSGEHPLTARVWVNRAWERFYGTGFVKTSENLGSQAEWPSHLDLVNWLACEFVQPTTGIQVNGQPAHRWDMKALQKLILLSATYRQSAKADPTAFERDPDNRLLARGPRFRLTGETIRDSALAISGLLAEKVGGPSVRPYMPKGVWDETSVYGDLRNYKEDTGAGLYRRTLYTIWKRTAAPPTALLFDAPNREICMVKRSRTDTPLQALALLNEVTFVEAARKLAEKMLTDGGTTSTDRLRWAFQAVTCRTPNPEELRVLNDGLERQQTYFKQNPQAASAIIGFGTSKSPALSAPELAAYTVSANVLFNLDEFLTR